MANSSAEVSPAVAIIVIIAAIAIAFGVMSYLAGHQTATSATNSEQAPISRPIPAGQQSQDRQNPAFPAPSAPPASPGGR